MISRLGSRRVALKLQLGKRSATICHFVRVPITEKVNGIRKVTGYSDWTVNHKTVRVRTVEREAPDMREVFIDPMSGAKAKKAPMVVLETATHFQFWNVQPERILFTVTRGALGSVLDLLIAAGERSIDLATLRKALQRQGSQQRVDSPATE